MILKLLIDFYRWLWGMPPIDAADGTFGLIILFGVFIDIVAIIGLIGMIIIKYTDGK